jgi:hypothetical protein
MRVVSAITCYLLLVTCRGGNAFTIQNHRFLSQQSVSHCDCLISRAKIQIEGWRGMIYSETALCQTGNPEDFGMNEPFTEDRVVSLNVDLRFYSSFQLTCFSSFLLFRDET